MTLERTEAYILLSLLGLGVLLITSSLKIAIMSIVFWLGGIIHSEVNNHYNKKLKNEANL